MKLIKMLSFFCVCSLLFFPLYGQWTELGGPNSFSSLITNQSSVKAIAVRRTSNSVFVNSRSANNSQDEVGQYYRPTASWYSWPNVSNSSVFGNSVNDIEIADTIIGVASMVAVGRELTGSNWTPVVKIPLGAGWSNLGSLLGSGQVEDIYVDSKFRKLYVVGQYYGNVSNDCYVAVWNGTNWSELGGTGSLYAATGGVGQCHSVVSDLNGNVYITTDNSTGIYKYNGSSWSFVSFNGLFHGLALFSCVDNKGNIYLSGGLQNASNSSSTYQYCVVKYNGVNFTELGGANSLPSVAVRSIDCDKDGNVYVAVGGGLQTSKVQKFCRGQWYELGGVGSFLGNGGIDRIKTDTAGSVLVGGAFTNSSGNHYVASYNNQTTSKGIVKVICQGSSFSFNGKLLSNSGTYYDTLVNRFACDSFITLNLIVNPKSYKTLNQTICSGSSFSVGSNTYSTSGSYTINLVNYLGCDSVVSLILKVLPNSTPTTITTSICQGEYYVVGANSFNTGGTYSLHLSNYLGCDSSINLNLTVNPKPVKQNISGSNWVSSGLQSNYFVGSITGINYLWQVQGGTINSGQGTNSIKVTWGNSSAYKLSVILTNASNCADTNVLVIHSAAVGLPGLSSVDNIKLFPNPSRDMIFIELMNFDYDNMSLVLQNAYGQIIAERSITSNNEKFDVSLLNAGVYILSIYNSKKQLMYNKEFTKF